MPRYLNPPDAPRPASRYAQGVALGPAAKRLVISGQIGLNAEGVLAQGLEGQMAQAFDNLLAVVAAAGLTAADIIKTTTYVTVPDAVAIYRKIREEKLGKGFPAATYLQVARLALAEYLVEIEGEAVREV